MFVYLKLLHYLCSRNRFRLYGSLKYYLFYSYYLPALYGTKCRINVTRLYMARNAVYLCK